MKDHILKMYLPSLLLIILLFSLTIPSVVSFSEEMMASENGDYPVFIENTEIEMSSGYTANITIFYPVHDSVGEQSLINNIQAVLDDWSPFTIRLGGFHRTANHWLFLTLQEGEAEVKRLYQAINTGILDDGGDFSWFLPHISLGLFVKEGILSDLFLKVCKGT